MALHRFLWPRVAAEQFCHGSSVAPEELIHGRKHGSGAHAGMVKTTSRLMGFGEAFRQHFRSYSRHVFACCVMPNRQGLMPHRRHKSMECNREVVPAADYDALPRCVSDSRRDHEAVMDKVAADADRLAGDSAEAALVVDETGFPKKGNKLEPRATPRTALSPFSGRATPTGRGMQ